MKKLLSLLILVCISFFVKGQTDGSAPIKVNSPSSGNLGNLLMPEYVSVDSTSVYTVDLTQPALGDTYVRCLVSNGIVESILHNGITYTPTNTNASTNAISHYLSKLNSGTGIVRVTVRWNKLNTSTTSTTSTSKYKQGYFAIRQEADLNCFNDSYQIYFTKIIGYSFFNINIESASPVCAGVDLNVPISLGGEEEWAESETRTFRFNYSDNSILDDKGIIIEKTIKKSDVTLVSSINGYTYKYNLLLKTPLANSLGGSYHISVESTSVLMKNGGNIMASIYISISSGKDEIDCEVIPLPILNPIVNNISLETGKEYLGGTFSYKPTNYNPNNTYVWSIKNIDGTEVLNDIVESQYSNSLSTFKFKSKGEYDISYVERTNAGGCEGPINILRVSIKDFNLSPIITNVGTVCSSDVLNGVNLILIKFKVVDGLKETGTTCKLIYEGKEYALGHYLLNNELGFVLNGGFLSNVVKVSMPLEGETKEVTVLFSDIKDGNLVKIANDISQTFKIYGSPVQNTIKHD